MDSAVRAILIGLRDERRERLRARVVDRNEASGYVFAAAHGGYLSNLNRDWYATLRRAGIDDLHFHDLRHSFGSRLAMHGVALHTIAELLGHRTLGMTKRHSHLSPGHLRAAVELLCRSAEDRPAGQSTGQ
jgi:integrase